MNYSHKPITLDLLSCVFPHKSCFENFSTIIHPGDRIAILGANGSGKTTLLKILAGIIEPTGGSISGSDPTRVGYLPQNPPYDANKTVWQLATEMAHAETLYEVDALMSRAGFAERKDEPVSTLSGGELMRLGLVRILAQNPAIILLDEPTNHLDHLNRSKLLDLLHEWPGTALIVTHDVELLQTWPTDLWHLHDGIISSFHGSYDDFLREQEWQQSRLIAQVEKLKHEKKLLKKAEAAHLKKAGKEKRSTQNALLKGRISRLEYSGMKENSEQSSGALRRNLHSKHEAIATELSGLFISEPLKPSFDIPALTRKNASIYIRDGSVRYDNRVILQDLHLNIQPGERYALMGDNGSGKSTLLKAIMGDPTVNKTGTWACPPAKMIGYIDQHYSFLQQDATAIDMIKIVQPTWDTAAIRKLLNDFLFRTPAEVSTPTAVLSGGERARLSLACLVAQAPSLLLLDEITNNLDLIARQQIIDALSAFPGTVVVISHDEDFLETIGVTTMLRIMNGTLTES